MDNYETIVPMIAIYGSCLIGISIALTSLNFVDTEEDPASIILDEPIIIKKHKEVNPSDSDSESESENIKHKPRKTLMVKQKNEIEFFRELGKFFQKDFSHMFPLVLTVLSIFSIISYFYINIIFSIALFIGALDFMFIFWYIRKIFIKSILALNFDSNATRICHKNWHIFINFIFSSFIATISSSVIAIFTLTVIYQHGIIPYLDKVQPENEYSFGIAILHNKKNGFVILMSFYYIGKNLFHIFNNIWESYHMNNKILEFLIFDMLRKKSLEFYSQGFYYNVMIRIHRQSIIVSEVLVILTIAVFQFAPKISIFFIYFYTVMLWFLMVFSIGSKLMFNFKNSIESVKMITVLKITFLYYFIIQFMIVYYRYFMLNNISVIEENHRRTDATIYYAYTVMVVIFLVQKLVDYIFDPKEIPRMKALMTDSHRFEFFLNDHILARLTASLLVVYFVYLILGFLGIFFIFFYFSVQRLVYRFKKYILLFDLYIRIILWASQVAPIHSLTFNKLLELVDKTYFQNYFMLLFIIPLFAEYKNFMDSHGPSSESYMNYLYVSLLSFIVSILMLVAYTKLIMQKYKETVISKQNQTEGTHSAKVSKLIRHKMHLIVSATLLTVLFIVVISSYSSFYLMLSIIIGLSIHLIQLVYTNKIRVKKFINMKVKRMQDDSFILQINSELADSASYLKSVCELSFSTILVEINKILLITYFFIHNLR